MKWLSLQNEVAELTDWSSEKKACHRTYDTLFLMYSRCKDTLFFHNFQEINKKSFSEWWGRGRETKKCNARCRHCTFIVCSARALSNGCKSRVSPNSGNYIAKGKGVHREVKSERSRRQTSDLTDRNFIQGIRPWVRLLYKPKPYSYSERSV